MSLINEYFDHVYVLNLEKRTDRKIAMLQKLGRLKIKVEFVEAIDGFTHKNWEEYQVYRNKELGNHPLEIAQQKKLIHSAGAWGYLKTYYTLLMDAKKRNFNRILCFDDDAIFHSDFETLFSQKIKLLPQDWKLLYLGASQHVRKIPQDLSYPNEDKLHWDENEPYYFPKATDGSFAIGIDSSVFNFLLHEISRMECPFDSGPLRAVIKTYPKKCFVLNPNIVIADVSESDIQGERNQHAVSKNFDWKLEDYDYPFQKDLVSVIMPVFNGENTIERSIRSILLQTYKEIELIVVNDHSTDKTREIVLNLIEEDDRINLIDLDENKGIYIARNEGIKASNGVTIAIQDADDVSLRQRIEKQLIPIYEKGVFFTVSRIYRSRCESHELDILDQKAMMKLVESRRVQKNNSAFKYEDKPILGLATSIYRRTVFQKFGLFEELRVAGDLEIIERILFHETHNTFNDQNNGHSFLIESNHSSTTFERLDEVLLICSLMNDNNISNKFKNRKPELVLLKKQFREKIAIGNLDLYVKLQKIEDSEYEIPALRHNTMVINQNKIEKDWSSSDNNNFTMSKHSLYGRNQELNDVYNSISWKITAPIRWVGKILLKMKKS